MIQVDISNIWGDISLPDLLGAEREVFQAHNALTGETCPGWMALPEQAEVDRILTAGSRIREESEVLVVIGSCLGPRAAIELLQGPNRNLGKGRGDPQILFAGNSLSTRAWNELMRLLEGKDISLCVISKSGTTLEPAIAFRGLRWLLERKYGTDEARQRIYAVTDGQKGALGQMAAEEGWECFAIPEGVGGRFSVLSPVGLLPMAVADIDIRALLRGAAEAKREFDLRSYENPVWLYAAARNLLYRRGKAIELLSSFEPGFQMMGRWWQQLFGESAGKDGKGIFPACAEFTADLHSLGQLIQEGERNLFETMVRFDAPAQKMVIGEDIRDLDGLNFLAGKTLDHVDEMACQGTVEAHVDGGVSMISIDCGELNEQTLGQLIWFFQLSCGICACMLGVDPFHQPGVEAYKRNMFRLLGKSGF